MRHQLANLGRNLRAGLRLALFLPVTRLAFRIDLAQLLLLFALSARRRHRRRLGPVGADGYFSWLGARQRDLFGAGLLLLIGGDAGARVPRSASSCSPFRCWCSPAFRCCRSCAPCRAYRRSMRCRMASSPAAVVDGWSSSGSYVAVVRAVAVALVPARPGRWWRALVGRARADRADMVRLVDRAERILVQGADGCGRPRPRYPNPASEPVLAAQRQLLDEALADLDDERPGVTDLYFVGFAGDARDDVFRKDMLAAPERDGRALGHRRPVARADQQSANAARRPEATVTNLRETLNEIGAAIDPSRMS